MTCYAGNLRPQPDYPTESDTMTHQTAFYRALAIPACLVWGVLEFLALQRSRLLKQRGQS